MATSVMPQWPEIPDDHPLNSFQKLLPGILSEANYNEIWQIELSAGSPAPFTTMLILQKFLRANANNVEKAAEQLQNTLKWRKEFQPLKALKEETWPVDLFNGLGYVSKIKTQGDKEKIVTWNVYGSVKDVKGTFGDLQRFMRWRVALMELSLDFLNLKEAKEPIPDYDPNKPTVDPYMMVQVHDYKNVSFLRVDPLIKAASSETIKVFSANYPELLETKYFVNVPFIMQFMFKMFRAILPATTFKKFQVVGANELGKDISPGVPQNYGGTGPSLEEGSFTVKLDGAKKEEEAPVAQPETAAEAKEEAAPAATQENKDGEVGPAPPQEKKEESAAVAEKLEEVKIEEPAAPASEKKQEEEVKNDLPAANPEPSKEEGAKAVEAAEAKPATEAEATSAVPALSEKKEESTEKPAEAPAAAPANA